MSKSSQSSNDPMADQKAKMREALDRKKTREHASAESARNTGAVHGPEVAGSAGQKMFRRKSG